MSDFPSPEEPAIDNSLILIFTTIHPLTGDWSLVWLSYGGEISEEVASVECLPRAGEAHEDEGLVLSSDHHVPVGLLTHRKDVRGHVLATTTTEHVYHLKNGQRRRGHVHFALWHKFTAYPGTHAS